MHDRTEGTTMASDELYIERILDAPPALVFRLWTSPEHLARWWGPKDFTAHSISMDFREGGAWKSRIRAEAYGDSGMSGTYREIIENERLVFTFSWDEDSGSPHETVVTVTFEDIDGRTKFGFHQAPFRSVSDRDSHLSGWGECIDRLEADTYREKTGRV